MIKQQGREYWLVIVGSAALLVAGCASTPPKPHSHALVAHIPGASVQDLHTILTGVIRAQDRTILRDNETRIEVTQRISKVAATDCQVAPEKQIYMIEPTTSGVALTTELYACDKGNRGEHTEQEVLFTQKRLTRELDAIKKLWLAKYDPSFKFDFRAVLGLPPTDGNGQPASVADADVTPRRRARNKAALRR